ncbi:MAG TPA: hypothetical protein VNK73_00700 [Actinomycetota bacterium]|jgi:hypothetical protein|nr:hypothetical protein [Actinomycetota bacterium]
MTLPPLTPRGFWIRVLVFGAGLLVYLWAALIMIREHSRVGVVLVLLLILFNLAGLVGTARRRPVRRPRMHDQEP